MQNENQQDPDIQTTQLSGSPEPVVSGSPPNPLPPTNQPQTPKHKPGALLLGLAILVVVIVLGGWQLFGPKNKKAAPVAHQPTLTEQAEDITTKLVTMDKQLIEDKSKPKTDDFTATAKERLNVIDKLLEEEGGPKAVLALANPGGFTNAPADAEQYLETGTELEGHMRQVHGHLNDSSGKIISDYDEYYIGNSDDNRNNSRLYLTDELPGQYIDSDINIPTIKFAKKYVAQTAAISKTGEPKKQLVLAASTTITKKIALILLNFKSNPTQLMTAAQAKAKLLTDSNSVNQFHQDSSLGKVSISGDVFGWYTIDADPKVCDAYGFRAQAIAAATKAGVNLNGYDNFVYLFPSASCNWSGYAEIPGSNSWLNGSMYATNHELGHNFGVHHANTLSCTDKDKKTAAISNSCTSNEYGDPYSIMGLVTRLHSMEHSSLLSFLDGNQVQTVTASGTYTLGGAHGTTTPQVIHIPRKVAQEGYAPYPTLYSLEYRQPKTPFDGFNTSEPVVNGVSIRIASTSRAIQTQLIDTTPDGNFSNGAIAVGKTFTDDANKITIKTLSIAPNGNATVEITINGVPPTCVPSSPTVAIVPTSQWGDPGQQLNYTVSITNRDSSACSNSTFNLTNSLPSGFKQTSAQLSVNLTPGATATIPINVASDKSTASGYYPFTENVGRSGQSTVSATANYNVTGATPPPPTSGNIKFIKTVASATKSGSNNTLVLTVPTGSGVAAGNRIIIGVDVGGHRGTQTCKDNRGNVYTQDGKTASNNVFVCSAYVAQPLVAGDTITITYPGFSGTVVAVANEFAGIASVSPIDGIYRSDGASSRNIVVKPPLDTTNANNLIFAAVTSRNLTPSSGFIKVGATENLFPIYQISSTTGSYSALGTSIGTWRSVLIAYKSGP